LISRAKGYRAKRHGPWQVSRTVWRRLEALLCLLIIMAQLALIVAHSWEVFLEEGAVATTRVSRAFLKDATGAPTISKAAVVPRRNAHDPLLCPTCQLLAQAKNGLTPHGPEASLPETSFAAFLDCSCHSSDLDLAVSAPRAPPYCL
jgi:hypothetical protein